MATQAKFLLFASVFITSVAAGWQGTEAGDRIELVVETGMHTAQIDSVSADRECTVVATGARDRTIRLWTAKSGALERTIYPPVGEGRHNGQVPAVALAPDGSWLAAVVSVNDGEAVMIFDRRSDAILWQSPVYGVSILTLAIAPDGMSMAASKQNGGGVIFWQRQPGGEFKQLTHDTAYAAQDAKGLAADQSGRYFATSDEGLLKRYDAPYTSPPRTAPTRSGKRPNAVAIPPQGKTLAVSYNDTTTVDIYDAETLAFVRAIESPDMDDPPNAIAWSRDGARLYAGGSWPKTPAGKVRVWDRGGTRKLADAIGPGGDIISMATCAEGAVVASAAPGVGRLGARGEQLSFWRERVTVDMRDKRFGDFKVSPDATRVRFGLARPKLSDERHLSQMPVLFDAQTETLLDSPEPPADLFDADTDARKIPLTGWHDESSVAKLDGKPLDFNDWEEAARSAAFAPDHATFVVGTDYFLRGYHRDGRELWPARAVLGYTWGLNIARSARIVVAAHGDGTIRWYRLSDGIEILALFVNAKDRRWVAWTPKGYYMASPGGEGLIGFRIHGGWKQAERFGRVQSYRSQFYRPDIVRQVLLDKDETTALRNVDAGPAARSTRGLTRVVPTSTRPDALGSRPSASGPAAPRTIYTMPTPPIPTARTPAFDDKSQSTTKAILGAEGRDSGGTGGGSGRRDSDGSSGGGWVTSGRDLIETRPAIFANDKSAAARTTVAIAYEPPLQPRAPVSTAPDLAAVVARQVPPMIKIDYPLDQSENPGGEIVLNYTVTSKAKLTQIRITINGATTTLPMGFSTLDSGLRTWAPVRLPKSNATISVVAEAEGGINSEPALLRLKWPETKKEVFAPRPLFALIAGVGTYDKTLQDEVPSLTGPKNDVEAFEKVLRSQVGPDKPFRLVDGGIRRLIDPTKETFETALHQLKSDSSLVPDSFVIIYFSGHGISEGDFAFLLPSDYDGDVWRKGIDADHIIKRFSNRAGPVVLFLDACQSGQVASGGRQGFAAGRVRNDARAGNILTFAAARGSQPAGATAARSLFTEVVVDGMRGKAIRQQKSLIRAVDLAYYVRNNVADRSNRFQVPVVSFNDAEIQGESPLDLVLSTVD